MQSQSNFAGAASLPTSTPSDLTQYQFEWDNDAATSAAEIFDMLMKDDPSLITVDWDHPVMVEKDAAMQREMDEWFRSFAK